MTLRVGLSAYDISGHELVHLAAAADVAGFESLWLGEHVVLPSDYGSEHPTTGDTAHQHHTGPIVDPSTKLLDPLVALAACASVTTQLRLATGIFILPLRHPLLTARMTLTLQDVAGGRFLLGVGSGWLEEEFEALAVPFDDRAARMDETLAILRRAWSGDTFSHDGPLFTFGNVQALARAGRRAPDPRRQQRTSAPPRRRRRRRLVQLRDTFVRGRRPTPRPGGRAARAAGADGEFPIYVRVANPDQADLARYEAEGFEHVLVWADQLWPAEGHPDDKRTAFAAAAADSASNRTSRDQAR